MDVDRYLRKQEVNYMSEVEKNNYNVRARNGRS